MTDTERITEFMAAQGWSIDGCYTIEALLRRIHEEIDNLRADAIRYDAIRSGRVFIEPQPESEGGGLYMVASDIPASAQYLRTPARIDAYINQWVVK